MSDPDTIVLVVEASTGRPGCALVQAAYLPGTYHSSGAASLLQHFEPATWVTAPNDDMRMVRGTRQQWLDLAEIVNDAHGPE